MKKKMNLLLPLMLLSILVILSACGGNSDESDSMVPASGDEQIKLSFAFFTTETTFLGQMVQYWADQIEERTDGRVDIEV